jgi:hypothetical protein
MARNKTWKSGSVDCFSGTGHSLNNKNQNGVKMTQTAGSGNSKTNIGKGASQGRKSLFAPRAIKMLVLLISNRSAANTSREGICRNRPIIDLLPFVIL